MVFFSIFFKFFDTKLYIHFSSLKIKICKTKRTINTLASSTKIRVLPIQNQPTYGVHHNYRILWGKQIYVYF